MKYKIKYLFLFFIFIVILALPEFYAEAAVNHKINIESYVCDKNKYNAATDAENATACINDFYDGNISSSYKRKNNDEIDEESLMLFIIYYRKGAATDVIGMNASYGYDPDKWIPIINPNNKNLITLSTKKVTESFPETDMYGTEANWSYGISLSTDDNTVNVLIQEESGAGIAFTQDTKIGYFVMKSKKGVSGNTQIVPADVENTTMGDVDGEKVPDFDASVDFTGITLKIAGATQSTDATLGTVTVKDEDGTDYFKPAFVSGSEQLAYTVVVPYSVDKIDLQATTNDTNGHIGDEEHGTNLGEKNLNVGSQTFIINSYSQAGNGLAYSITVYRLSNDATLSGLSLSNDISLTFNGSKSYTINNVPFATKGITVTATPNHENAYINSGDGSWTLSESGSTVNERDVIVKAENCLAKYKDIENNVCNTESYNIRIYRVAASTEARLKSLKYDGNLVPNFDKDTKVYDLGNVANDVAEMVISAEELDTGKAIITAADLGKKFLVVGDNEFDVHVTAEDSTTKEKYTIKVHRLSNDATLQTMTFASIPSNHGKLNTELVPTIRTGYKFEYDEYATDISVVAVVNDTNKASVAILNALPAEGTNYTPNTVSETFPIPSPTIIVAVTAEDGTIHNYEITTERKTATDNTLSGLKVVDPDDHETIYPFDKNVTFSSNTRRYEVTVAEDISSIEILATPTSRYGNVKEIKGKYNDLAFGDNEIEVVVEAEDKSTSSYFVMIHRTKYSIKTLSSLTVSDKDGNTYELKNALEDGVYDYELKKSIPFRYDKITINATATDTEHGATVSNTGTHNLSVGDTTFTLTVTAQDTTTQKYTIKINRKYNSDNSISDLTFAGETAILKTLEEPEEDVDYYEVEVPNSVKKITPDLVSFTKSSDATASVTQELSLSTKDASLNIYEFTVTSQSGRTHTYRTKITRTKSSDNSISLISLKVSDDDIRTCVFNSSNKCTINVPVNTTEFSIVATIDPEASIIPANNTTLELPAETSEKDYVFTVTAENSLIETYTVHVSREKSSVATLSSLIVDGIEYVNNIDSRNKVVITYDTAIDDLHEKATISAVVSDSGKATLVDEDNVLGENTLAYGKNTLNFKVQAENGTKVTYSVEINRNKKTNANLSSLKIDDVEYIDRYTDTEDTITLNLGYGTHKVNIQGVVEDNGSQVASENATIKSGTGDINLTTGKNELSVVVAAQDRDVTKTYKIVINRDKNPSNGIEDVYVAGVKATKDKTTGIYSVTVDNEVDKIIPDGANANISVTYPEGYKLTDYDNDPTPIFTAKDLDTQTIPNVYKFKVKSESGDEAEYQVNITRKKSAYKLLKSITVSNGSFSPSFTPEVNEYEVTVPMNATTSVISYEKVEGFKGTVTGANGTISITKDREDYTITVTPEDNSTPNVYTLTIIRAQNTSNVLSNLKVLNIGEAITEPGYALDPSFGVNKTSFTVNVAGDVEKVNILASVPEEDRSTILAGSIGEKDLQVGDNNFTITVTAENGKQANYALKIVRALKPYNKLSDLKVNDETITDFNQDTETYTLADVANSVNKLKITATTQDTDASYEVANADNNGNVGLNVGDNEITITVTAQNGSKKYYKVNVKRLPSTDATLKSLSVKGYTLTDKFDSGTLNYTVIVDSEDFDIKKSDITATPNYTLATVTKDNDKDLVRGDNNYNILVTAEDGTTTITYTINFKKPASKNATLKEVNITNGTLSPTLNETDREYTITVPQGAETFKVEGTPTIENLAQVSGNGTYNVSDYTGDNNSRYVTLTVTAEDASVTEDYKFHVVYAKSANALLSSLSVSGYTLKQTSAPTKGFESAITNYTIGNVVYGTEKINIKATSTAASSNIAIGSLSSVYNFDEEITIDGNTLGQHTIKITVTPEDNIASHKKEYTINYNVVYSNDKLLSSLEPSTGDLTPGFSQGTSSYTLSVANDVDSITFTVVANDPKSRVSSDDSSYTYTNIEAAELTYPLEVGENTCHIYIKSEDDTVGYYTVVVTRSEPLASSNNLLQSLSITNHTIKQQANPTLGFSSTVEKYTINNVAYKTESLEINATPQDGNSKLYYYVDGIKQSSNTVLIPTDATNHVVTVSVEAPNGDIKTYSMYFTKVPSSEVGLEYIRDNFGLISYQDGTKTYSIDVEESITSITLTVKPDDDRASIIIDSKNYSSPYPAIHVKNNLALGQNNIIITVTAEDNTIDTYKVVVNRLSGTELITSHNWGHTIEDGYIKTVALGKTALEVKNELDNDNNKLYIYQADGTTLVKDNEIVGTGYIVKLIKNLTLNDSKIIVVKGDVSGDGLVKINDATRIVNHLIDKKPLTGEYLIAADVSDDGVVKINDATRIVNHLIDKKHIDYPKK